MPAAQGQESSAARGGPLATVTYSTRVDKIDPNWQSMQSIRASVAVMLAILTQLFDLQLRHTASEQRILQANALSQSLYRDPQLLTKVRQMVDDYYSIMDGWLELFKIRADDTFSECHRVLRSMAGGTMEPPH